MSFASPPRGEASGSTASVSFQGDLSFQRAVASIQHKQDESLALSFLKWKHGLEVRRLKQQQQATTEKLERVSSELDDLRTIGEVQKHRLNSAVEGDVLALRGMNDALLEQLKASEVERDRERHTSQNDFGQLLDLHELCKQSRVVIASQVNELNELKGELRKANLQLATRQGQVTTLEQSLQQHRVDSRKHIEALKRQVEKRMHEVADLNMEMEAAKSDFAKEKEHLEARVRLLFEEKQTIDRCLQEEKERSYQERQVWEDRMNELLTKNAQLTEKLGAVNVQYASVDRLDVEKREVGLKLEEMQKQLLRTESERSGLEGRLAHMHDIEAQNKELGSQLEDRARKAAEAEQLMKRMELSLQKAKLEAQSSTKTASEAEEKRRALEYELETIKSMLSQAREQIQLKESQLQSTREDLHEVKEVAARYEKQFTEQVQENQRHALSLRESFQEEREDKRLFLADSSKRVLAVVRRIKLHQSVALAAVSSTGGVSADSTGLQESDLEKERRTEVCRLQGAMELCMQPLKESKNEFGSIEWTNEVQGLQMSLRAREKDVLERLSKSTTAIREFDQTLQTLWANLCDTLHLLLSPSHMGYATDVSLDESYTAAKLQSLEALTIQIESALREKESIATHREKSDRLHGALMLCLQVERCKAESEMLALFSDIVENELQLTSDMNTLTVSSTPSGASRKGFRVSHNSPLLARRSDSPSSMHASGSARKIKLPITRETVPISDRIGVSPLVYNNNPGQRSPRMQAQRMINVPVDGSNSAVSMSPSASPHPERSTGSRRSSSIAGRSRSFTVEQIDVNQAQVDRPSVNLKRSSSESAKVVPIRSSMVSIENANEELNPVVVTVTQQVQGQGQGQNREGMQTAKETIHSGLTLVTFPEEEDRILAEWSELENEAKMEEEEEKEKRKKKEIRQQQDQRLSNLDGEVDVSGNDRSIVMDEEARTLWANIIEMCRSVKDSERGGGKKAVDAFSRQSSGLSDIDPADPNPVSLGHKILPMLERYQSLLKNSKNSDTEEVKPKAPFEDHFDEFQGEK